MIFFAELIVSILLLIGGVFIFVGSVGLLKLPDFYMRLHAPTKATTLGLGSLLIGSLLLFTVREASFSVHELLITLFLFITAPVSALMMAKTAMHQKTKIFERTQGKSLVNTAREQLPPLTVDDDSQTSEATQR
jgi:multicomponent K+:H+ antiporter subunit G